MAPFARPFANAADDALAADGVLVAPPSVVVVDPAFESYKPLAASARAGKLLLHFRSAGSDALRLARHHHVDAWLIAPDLDDMSGFDFVELLRTQYEAHHKAAQAVTSKAVTSKAAASKISAPTCVAMVGDRSGDPNRLEALEAGADHTITKPITFRDLELILGMTPEERQVVLPSDQLSRAFLTLPIGVGAAVVAIAVVMMS